MADLTGKLNIVLRREGTGLKVHICSSRPVSASRVFVGKGLEETTNELPSLFGVCSVAQSCACVCACEAVIGLEQIPEVAHARRLLVDAETVKEHLWRLLLDWPRFLGATPNPPAMARVLAAFNRLRGALGAKRDLFRPGATGAEPDLGAAAQCLGDLSAVTAEGVLGAPPQEWLGTAGTAEDLIAWSRDIETPVALLLRKIKDADWSALGRSEVPPLPRLSAEVLEEVLGGDGAGDFVASPLWAGAPAETSPFTRNRGHPAVTGLGARFGNGLLTRLAAQLVETAALQQRLREGMAGPPERVPLIAACTSEGVGIAQVQAARGLLVHRVAAGGDRIRSYRILAPTEWNFHPKGVVAQGVAGLEPVDDETLRLQVGLFVTAVDPCVEYHVTIR
jgi:coenzyme F420-reducing hydrogenase alpha subunit